MFDALVSFRTSTGTRIGGRVTSATRRAGRSKRPSRVLIVMITGLLLCAAGADARTSVYVAGSRPPQENVVQYDAEAASGELVPKSPPSVTNHSEGSSYGVAASPDGKSVYVTNGICCGGAPGSIAQYNVDPLTGKLSPKTPATVAAGENCLREIAVSPDGKNAYATNCFSGGILQYGIEPLTGRLIPKSPAVVVVGNGDNPWGLAITPDSKSLYVACCGNKVYEYDIEAITGQLTPKSTSSIAAPAPVSVAVSPDGGSAYVTNSQGGKCERCGSISEYTINPVTGVLSAKTPATVPGPCCAPAWGMAITPDGKSAYVADSGSPGFIGQYDIEPGTGVLFAKSPSAVPSGKFPLYIAVSPDGKSAYATNETSRSVSQYDIDENGNLSAKATAEVPVQGNLPFGIALSVPPPVVASVAPGAGPEAGGTSVTIAGANFTGATEVHFGEAAAKSFTVNADGSIAAESPAESGTVDVTVTTPKGTSETGAADHFTYVPPPTVTAVGPTKGSEAGGTSVTISGTNFTMVSAVKFGAANAANFKVNSESSITAVAPAGTGTVDITIATPGGTSASSSVDQFAFLPPPTVSEVSPREGPEAGGTSVSITGTNFKEVSAVKFGSANAKGFTVNSEGSISAETPAGSGTVDVTVTTSAAQSATSSADTFVYRPVPVVTKVEPSEGPDVGGSSVTISGSGFTAGSTVRFGAPNAPSAKVNSQSSITATAPSGSGAVDVTVSTAGGTSATSAADRFTYVPQPAVSNVQPNEGPEAGATAVTITGSNLAGVTQVKFGASNAKSFKVDSSSSIAAESPPGTATVDVTVTSAGGTSALSTADQFSYVPAPAVTKVEPTEGPAAGATTVTITGSNLTGASQVKFGSSSAASYTVNSGTSITAVSPAGAGTVDITVTTTGGTSATGSADQYSFRPPPTVSKVEANDGPAAGGTLVTITGTNLGAATAVRFGSANAASFKVNSATSITAEAPKGSGGIVDVTVTTAGGTSTTGAADQFAYLEAPEYGRCKPVTAGTGKYENSGCTKPGGTKKYEWYPAFGGPKPLEKAHFSSKLSGTTLKLETKSKTVILCHGETGGGEYATSKAIAGVTLKLTGCEGPGGKCASAGGGDGEIATNALAGALGVVVKSAEGPLKNKLGTDLKPAPGIPVVEFTCGGQPDKLRGAVIVELKANAMLATFTLKFTASKAIQKPTHFEGSPNELLEVMFGKGPFEQDGLTATSIQTNEEPLEVNAVV